MIFSVKETNMRKTKKKAAKKTTKKRAYVKRDKKFWKARSGGVIALS